MSNNDQAKQNEMTAAKFKKMSNIQRERYLKSLTTEEIEKAEGKIFINLAKTSNSKIGRMLDFYHKQTFSHPTFRHFATLEGFWLWLKIDGHPDALRTMSGKQVTHFAQKLQTSKRPTFKEDFISGAFWKISGNPELLKSIRETEPMAYVHYYYDRDLMIYVANRQWVYDEYEKLHEHIFKNATDAGVPPYLFSLN